MMKPALMWLETGNGHLVRRNGQKFNIKLFYLQNLFLETNRLRTKTAVSYT